MNIVVAMKQIRDLQQIRIRNREPVWDDVPLTFGNIDKNALEAAVQIKEAGNAQEVIALCVGSNELEDTVKEALAAGADEARLIITEKDLASNQNAHLIAEGIKELDSVNLILLGEGSGDDYSSQVGSRLGHILGWPQIGYASHIEVSGNTLRATRLIENVEEILEVNLPAVVTVASDINLARIPSVTQILRAGRKPKESREANSVSSKIPDVQVETISNLAPESQRKQIVIKSVSDLVKVLDTEGFRR